MEIKWSEKAILKLLSEQFKEITKKPWIITWFMKMIDAKFGKREFLHKWTYDQHKYYTRNKN